MSNKDEWKNVCEAGDDTIDYEILSWANVIDLWESHDNHDKFSVVNDVLTKCSSVDVIKEEWDGGMPGQSGVFFEIESNNPDRLKEEIKIGINELFAPPPKLSSNKVKIGECTSIEEVVTLLKSKSEYLKRMRTPPPGGMPQTDAKKLDEMVSLLQHVEGNTTEITNLCSSRFYTSTAKDLMQDLTSAIERICMK